MQPVTCHLSSTPTLSACTPRMSQATHPADLNWPGETEMTGRLAIEHPSRHRQGTPALLHPWICVNSPSPEPRPTSETNVRLGKAAHGQPFTHDAEVRTARPPLCNSEVSRMNKHLRQAARMASKQGQQLHAVLVVQRCCTTVGPRRQQPRAVWAAGHAGHDACAAAPQPVSPASVLLRGGVDWPLPHRSWPKQYQCLMSLCLWGPSHPGHGGWLYHADIVPNATCSWPGR